MPLALASCGTFARSVIVTGLHLSLVRISGSSVIKWKGVLKQDMEVAFNLFCQLGEVSSTTVFQDHHEIGVTAVQFKVIQLNIQTICKSGSENFSPVHWL